MLGLLSRCVPIGVGTKQHHRTVSFKSVSTISDDLFLLLLYISAAQNWLEDRSSNHGILISVTTLTGEPVEDGIIRFAQRGKHHDTKQPILVMFTDDVTRKTNPRTKFETRGKTLGKTTIRSKFAEKKKKNTTQTQLQTHFTSSDLMIFVLMIL